MREGRVGRGVTVRRAVKAALDVVIAAAVLFATLPLFAITAVAIAIEDGLPVFFAQERVGRGGRRFRILKFRSMRVNDLTVEQTGQVRADHDLVTRVGRVIRRLKIDELPQLLSVLTLDMSLVGPRPTVAEQVERYDDFQRRRLNVRPGLTGWAQVNGNTELTWDERIMLDVWYVEHWSLALDFTILARTFDVILGGERRNETTLAEARAHALSTAGRR